MYEFLADEEWWKHSREIAEAFDKIEIHWEAPGYKGSYLPDITMEEVRALKVPHVIVHSNSEDWSKTKPVYVITIRKWPLGCWIRIKHEEDTKQNQDSTVSSG